MPEGNDQPDVADDLCDQGGWKRDVLNDFHDWLGRAGNGAWSEQTPEPEDCDQRDLFAEFAALRQEIRLQNREQSKASRELTKAASMYETASRGAKHREEEIEFVVSRAMQTAEDRLLRDMLEVRDALFRGLESAKRLRDARSRFGRQHQGAKGIAEGYELAIRRIDRIFSSHGVRLTDTEGSPFDSRLMNAIEARNMDSVADGEVVETLLKGYVRDGRVLRLAEVAVSRNVKGQ